MAVGGGEQDAGDLGFAASLVELNASEHAKLLPTKPCHGVAIHKSARSPVAPNPALAAGPGTELPAGLHVRHRGCGKRVSWDGGDWVLGCFILLWYVC